MFTANERREPFADHYLKTAVGFALFDHPIERERSRDSFQLWLPAIFTRKEAFDEMIRGGADHHFITSIYWSTLAGAAGNRRPDSRCSCRAISSLAGIGFRPTALTALDECSETVDFVGCALEKVRKKLTEATGHIDKVGVRQRAITRKLRDVQTMPEGDAVALLGVTELDVADADELAVEEVA